MPAAAANAMRAHRSATIVASATSSSPSSSSAPQPSAARPSRVVAIPSPKLVGPNGAPLSSSSRVTAASAVVAPDRAAPKDGPLVINGQVLHSITTERLEIVRSIDDHIENQVYPILKDSEACWQPADFLPDSSSPDFVDQVAELRKRTDNLPDDYFVVLVGDMITEEALPTYMAMLNTLDGVRDETGASPTPWARWTRAWTAEENRHGDLMNKYCYLSGRVNMKAVELTIQNLITSGMDPKTENNPYYGFIYTSFQERATKISHGNTALHAAEHGDKVLGKICAAIAGDEARHERAYQKIMDKLFELDPSGSMLAFNDMMQKQIVMPAHLMDDRSHGKANTREGKAANLFKDFSSVAQATGTYTGHDYVAIMEFLMKHWDIEKMTGLSSEAQKAQEDVCLLLGKLKKLTSIQDRRLKTRPSVDTKFSWVFNREVPVIQV